MHRFPPGDIDVLALAQAMGRVSVQADCTLDEALCLISDRAVVDSRTAYEVADAVIDRSIRFGEHTRARLRSAEVARAQRMVSAQVGCAPREALMLMNVRARRLNRSVEQLAELVLDGTIRFA